MSVAIKKYNNKSSKDELYDIELDSKGSTQVTNLLNSCKQKFLGQVCLFVKRMKRGVETTGNFFIALSFINISFLSLSVAEMSKSSQVKNDFACLAHLWTAVYKCFCTF
jgi:hypothetical protein